MDLQLILLLITFSLLVGAVVVIQKQFKLLESNTVGTLYVSKDHTGETTDIYAEFDDIIAGDPPKYAYLKIVVDRD